MTAATARRTIPLNAITGRSPANCRSETDDADLPSLAASIQALGLLQPLIVSPMPDLPGKVWIDDGGRRHAALLLLRDTGHLAAHAPIECDVAEPDEALARERSLAANVMRRDLHPVDQCEAFTALVDAHVTVEKIAADFGVTIRHVNQRLRLTMLSPRVRAAWRAGRFGAEIAAAFTASTSHAEQDALLDQQPLALDAQTIRSRLRNDAMRTDCKEAFYVGLDDYVAAGGAIDDNLFQDFALCRDGALLRRLAREKMLAAGTVLIENLALGSCQLRDDIPDYQAWTALPRDFTRIEQDQLEDGVDLVTDVAINVGAMLRKSPSRVSAAALILWLSAEGLCADVGMVPPRPDKATDRPPPKKAKADAPKVPPPAMPPEKPIDDSKPLLGAIRDARTAGVVMALLHNPVMAALVLIAALQARHNTSPARLATIDRNMVKAARTLPHVGFERAFEEVRYAVAAGQDGIDQDKVDGLLAQVVAESVRFADHLDGDAKALLRFVAVNAAEDYTAGALERFDYDAYFAAVPRGAALAILEDLGVATPDTRKLGKLAMRDAARIAAKEAKWLPAEMRLHASAAKPAAAPEQPLADAMREALDADEAPAPADEPFAADGVRRFLEADCMRKPDAKVKASILYDAYRAFVSDFADLANDALTLREFGEAITALGIAKHREKTGVQYLGIALTGAFA